MVTSALHFHVCSWIKIVGTGAGVCRHTSQTMTLFMHALNLIVTQPTPTPHPPSAGSAACASMCSLPSDEKLITLHLYQSQPALLL